MRRLALSAGLFALVLVATAGCNATAPSRPPATTQGILLLAPAGGTGPLIAQRSVFGLGSAWIIDSDRGFTPVTGGLTVTSSNATVLRPLSGGLFQAGNAGAAALQASYQNFSASLTLTVIDPSTPFLQVILSDSPLLTGQSTVRFATRVAGNSTQDVPASAVSLQSRTPEIATIQNGAILWRRSGNAEIIFTFNGEATTVIYGVQPRPF